MSESIYSPNLAGSWNLAHRWNVPLENIYKYEPKTINIPGVGNTNFYMNNTYKPDTVRLWRGEPWYETVKDRVDDRNKRKALSLKHSGLEVHRAHNDLEKFRSKYWGPKVGQWWSNQPTPAFGMAQSPVTSTRWNERVGYASGNRPHHIKYMDVRPSNLANWFRRAPMDSGRVFVVPQNVIKSQSRGILTNIRADDPNVFSRAFIDNAKEQRRKSQLSFMGKFFERIKSAMKGGAGAGMVTPNVSMGGGNVYSPKIKGMGSAIDDPSNFYLNLNAGGIVSLVI